MSPIEYIKEEYSRFGYAKAILELLLAKMGIDFDTAYGIIKLPNLSQKEVKNEEREWRRYGHNLCNNAY